MENNIALGMQGPENVPRRRGIQGIFNTRMLMLLVMAVRVIALGGCRTGTIGHGSKRLHGSRPFRAAAS